VPNGRGTTDEFRAGAWSYLAEAAKEEIPMTTMLTAARAEALFTSRLATGSTPSAAAVEEAIRSAVSAHGGVRGCAADLAGEYGDHPDLAVARMRWALDVIDQRYAAHRRGSWALVA
jgi:hypothetical protein